MSTNRGQNNERNDWLTPPKLIELLGPFDFDPCCPPVMPWRTAKVMVSLREKAELLAYEKKFRKRILSAGFKVVYPRGGDGHDYVRALERGYGFWNPPFTPRLLLPFVEDAADHGDGIMVTPAKSTDAKWAQRILSTCDAVKFLDDRLLFCHEWGQESSGVWSPYMISAWGPQAVDALKSKEFIKQYPGVLMKRIGW